MILGPTALALSLVAVLSARAANEPELPPLPSLVRIDCQHPERYLKLELEMGNEAPIRAIADAIAPAKLKEEQKLAAIWHWIYRNFEDRESLNADWIDFDRMVDQHAYGGCATYSVLFGALARAAGIPAVWVKSLDIDWIREFKRTGEPGSWDGHVFLEVFVRGRWMLLNPTDGILYQNYDTRSRVLPGNRLAYDKGENPFTLVLSMRYALWKMQTRRFLKDIDLQAIGPASSRVAEPIDVRGESVYVVCDNPMCSLFEDRGRASRLVIAHTFNTDFDLLLPKARGKDKFLIVLAVGDRLVLPDAYWRDFTGLSADQFRKRVAGLPTTRLDKKLSDGTNVVVLYGRTHEDIAAAINRYQ